MRRFQKYPGTPVVPAVKPSNEGLDAQGQQPTLSIEEMPIEQVLEGREVPTLDEEVVDLQAADEAQAQAVADVAETTRVEDVTDVMLNVADTLETTNEITPQQAMLTDTVSEMAVAGSDGDPDDVIPTAADVVEGKVSLESFVEDIRKRAAEIWQRIRAFCLEIWKTIKEFFSRIFHAAPRLLSNVKDLREKVAARKKEAGELAAKSDTVTVMVGTNSISYPEYMVHNAKELTKGLGELGSLGRYAFGPYLKDCKAMGEYVATELKKFDPKNAGEHLKNVALNVQKNNFGSFPGNPQTGYLGCFDVDPVRLDKNKTRDLSHAQVVAALRNSGMKLRPRQGSASLVNTKNGFQTMTFAEMEQTLNSVEALVKQVVAFESSADGKAIEKVRQDLIDGGNHASAEVAKLAGNDDAGKMERAFALDVMKAMANFNTTLTRWMTELTMPVTKKIYQTCRTSLVLVDKSLDQYKPVPATAPAAGGIAA
jgi:hypothetical protein